VVGALARSNLGDVVVSPTIVIPPGTRRRATLAVARIGKRLLLGFAERASHRLVDLKECHILTEDLVRLIAPLRDRLGILVLANETADFVLTATETGVDFVVVRKRPLGLADREALADFAETADLARVSWRASPTAPAEPVAARRSPQIRIGDDLVAFAPGAFLQPSREGEARLARIIRDAISGLEGTVADLFCGLGTFALPSSRTNAVYAFDSDSTAVSALRNVARGRQLVAQTRDLFREPLTVTELAAFSGVIIDPPRAGAQAQARTLADSGVATVVYVSCNPTSFARDAAILVEGGYRLEQAVPIDQFAWSPHVELVGVMRR
jgi:23S rRNA (uracil1939-C5)-methyltransferase